MTVVLCNDDGIDAPGLRALELACRAVSLGDIWVIAPQDEQSYMGHRLTARSGIGVENRGSQRYAVGGTPADCVRIALHALEIKPTILLSGVNDGGNLGVDVFSSGTVAAAREAAFFGVPAIAFSKYKGKNCASNWADVAAFVEKFLAETVIRDSLPTEATFWNVNLPAGVNTQSAIKETFVDHSPLAVSYRKTESALEFHYNGDYHARPRVEGSDIDLCFSGAATLSRIQIRA